MKKIDMLTDEFKLKYEKFIIGCDSIEEIGQWNKEEYGEMDVFLESDLVGIIIRLIASDGNISDKENEYLNKMFGFVTTVEWLEESYAWCIDDVKCTLDEQFLNGLSILRSFNEELADAYKELLGLVCDIIIASDGIISQAEIEDIKGLRDSL